MKTTDTERLYRLLPAVYRLRDAEQGYPLRELVGVLARQGQVIEADIERLYDNWFIETCNEWAVPYMGDLLGVRGLLPPERAGWSQRALVANTLQYRQRKGTLPLLEQLVRDVTGTWTARAVELYAVLGVTQHLDHLRPGRGGWADLRALREGSRVGSVDDPLCYTADLRQMSGTRQAPPLEAERPAARTGRRLAGVGRARPNLPNLALYIWRLKTYRVARADAHAHGDGRFSFSALGLELPLYHCPARRSVFDATARAHELPQPLRNGALEAERIALLQARAQGHAPGPGFLYPQPAIELYQPAGAAGWAPLPLGALVFADLSGWEASGAIDRMLARLALSHPGQEWQAIIDVERGRIWLPPGAARPERLQVSYGHAFSDDIGGGSYLPAQDVQAHPTLVSATDPQAGLVDWVGRQRPPALLTLAGNRVHRLDTSLGIDLKGGRLAICAADQTRPVLIGNLEIHGDDSGAELLLCGLLIAGTIRVSGTLGRLSIRDCTCLPGADLDSKGAPWAPAVPALVAAPGAMIAQVDIQRCIVGPLILPLTVSALAVADSIIDAAIAGGVLPALAGNASGSRPGPQVSLQRVSVFGAVRVAGIALARDVLFADALRVSGTVASGAVNHCYLAAGSSAVADDSCVKGGGRLVPGFGSRRYGAPDYGQLALDCPAEIRAGGSDGAEIGAFHRLRQPQREGALLAQMEEYLRFGLEAGLIYMN